MSDWPFSTDVGADIESLCSKCGDVWHVVVAKVGRRIVKVQCKQCGGLHRYRPPPGSEGERRTQRARPAPPTDRPQRARAATRTRSAPPAPQPRDPGAPARPYGLAEIYEAGEKIAHPRFGEGVVEEVLGPRKVKVYFSGERKILAMGTGPG